MATQVFLEPLKKNQSDDAQPNKILTKMEMQSIFGNIEQIYQVATNFLRCALRKQRLAYSLFTNSCSVIVICRT